MLASFYGLQEISVGQLLMHLLNLLRRYSLD
ncbi:hypothetical protein BD749_1936 [Pontibacter ramchanderi]|uniref:Uncharacterized protein n=1 Tax=Pontibacter ramchanderi TaxID=1179743 RepID=A0A2N3UBR3_9BACT|nr:hypothetical protein BD749_1936 [Pontibacter ramchanderi]